MRARHHREPVRSVVVPAVARGVFGLREKRRETRRERKRRRRRRRNGIEAEDSVAALWSETSSCCCSSSSNSAGRGREIVLEDCRGRERRARSRVFFERVCGRRKKNVRPRKSRQHRVAAAPPAPRVFFFNVVKKNKKKTIASLVEVQLSILSSSK